jgi:hypothetical protein
VQRTSESIGTLAAALAKAQCQLVNPEKSLAATIESERPGGPEQTFRYAPLSSGLEIVRKTLGQHELAVAQTTSIDQSAGIVNLTTVLAHSSGEWIASDWPVCPISDTATPHRMGKALTYARRYALFTLVGIAGEDDLDAPDLIAPTNQRSEPNRRPGNGSSHNGHGRLNGGHGNGQGRRGSRSNARAPRPPALDAESSAKLRDKLIAEVTRLPTADDAALWAQRQLPEKNKLTAADAGQVELAFQLRLSALSDLDPSETGPNKPRVRKGRPDGPSKRQAKSTAIDKTVLVFPEPRRVRDRDHVKFVATHPCLVCGRKPADAHHLRFAQSRALGRKVSDEFTVPLCRGHHRELHHAGDEVAWWTRVGIEPLVAARDLWLESHPIVRPERSAATQPIA